MSLSKRQKVFLFACVPTRLAIAIALLYVPQSFLMPLATLAAIVALTFMTIFAFGLRKTGLETGGKPIWWNDKRPIHAFMYAAIAYALYTNQRKLAATILMFDTLLGLIFFLNFHKLV